MAASELASLNHVQTLAHVVLEVVPARTGVEALETLKLLPSVLGRELAKAGHELRVLERRGGQPEVAAAIRAAYMTVHEGLKRASHLLGSYRAPHERDSVLLSAYAQMRAGAKSLLRIVEPATLERKLVEPEPEPWREKLLDAKGNLRKPTRAWLQALSEPASTIEEIRKRATSNLPRYLSAPLQLAGWINHEKGSWRRTEAGAAALEAGRV